MNFIRRIYLGLIVTGSFLQNILLLVIRIYWGYAFFFAGFSKLQDPMQVAPFFENLGIPLPLMMTYLVGGVEAIGGLCLLVGFASRIAAIPLAITMIVALTTAHKEVTLGLINSFSNIYREHKVFLTNSGKFISKEAFIYLLMCLIIFCFGPGRFSIDFILEKLFSVRKK